MNSWIGSIHIVRDTCTSLSSLLLPKTCVPNINAVLIKISSLKLWIIPTIYGKTYWIIDVAFKAIHNMISVYLFSFILSSFHYTLYQQSYLLKQFIHTYWFVCLEGPFPTGTILPFTFLKPLRLPLSSSHLVANFAFYCTNKFEVIRRQHTQILITITICLLASVPINPAFLCVTIEKLSMLLYKARHTHSCWLKVDSTEISLQEKPCCSLTRMVRW